MINTKELRLGNLFANIEDNSIYKVTKINEDSIEGICSNNMGWFGEKHFHLIEQVLPIEITEEWFKIFGFKKEKDLKLYRLENEIGWIEILLKVGGGEFVFYWKDAHIAKIKYVHELQNLFFALTHEELTQVSEWKK